MRKSKLETLEKRITERLSESRGAIGFLILGEGEERSPDSIVEVGKKKLTLAKFRELYPEPEGVLYIIRERSEGK